ncbi:MAG: 23S rRNA (pseudouridine(1915)-N(3))-methyltransferase RlmH [Ruminococcus sp.]|jgi:23S rRNA (pseudouridine1915-N3)-methyltransferase|nr:23S rRNA (pseudouridine(1915)-N(3))-methyltransferase RlmH [Ruminococcus sp.]
MKIKIICVGKLKEQYLKDACAEYQKRLRNIEIVELPEMRTIQSESENIKKHLSGYSVALCIEGEQLGSVELSKHIYGKMLPEVCFVIGSSEGLSDEVKNLCNFRLSFGRLTFPHQLMRVILLEQIYRIHKINQGEKYHK